MWLILALLLFCYPFLFYPPLLWLLARMLSGRRRVREESSLPSVALVICAYNEERIIRQKMENSLRLDYPREKLQIVVVSDGSTDRTAAIVREYRTCGIEVIDQRPRRGKVANLNAVLPSRTEEVLVLSDANVMYQPDAVRKLVARLADPSVGCVSGKVVLVSSAPTLDQATGDYYSMEWSLFENESRLHSMPGADGAMYALRRELFRPCPADTLIEDFIIPMSIVRQGRRAVFEPEAVGLERGPATLDEEFRRKVRIAAGGLQAVLRGGAWPGRAPAIVWFMFVSHKLLRWLSPLVGAAALALAAASPRRPLSQMVIIGFLLLVNAAIIRLLVERSRSVLNSAFYFLFGQVAMAAGLVKYLLGKQTVLWAKANR